MSAVHPFNTPGTARFAASLWRQLARSWQALWLLLIATPLAWAAVSVSGLTIQTVQQLSFAQTEVAMTVGGTQTLTATVRLSPGAVSYRSENPLVATVDATTGGVTALAAGTTRIVATQAAAGNFPTATASYTVRVTAATATLPAGLVFNATTVPSTTLSHQLQATSNSPAPITYQVTGGQTGVVLLDPSGSLRVAGTGTVEITATQAPQGNYLGATATASFTVQPGEPIVVVTQPPPAQVNAGETFTVRYRANSLGILDVTVNQIAIGLPITLVSQTVRTSVDQEEVVTFQAGNNTPITQWTETSTIDINVYFDPVAGSGFTNTVLGIDNNAPGTRTSVVPPPLGNLGDPIVLLLDRSIDRASVLPPIRDANGNFLRACNQHQSTNPAVMRLANWAGDLALLQAELGTSNVPDAWRTMAVGETTLTCGPGITPVRVTVLPRDPQLAQFTDLTARVGQPPITLVPPSSRNLVGGWTYEVVNPTTGAPVARVVNGNQIEALAAGEAVVRATQAAAGDYATASIPATLSVTEAAAVPTFADVSRTWGDPPFQMPPPTSTDTVTPFTFSIISGNGVAEVTPAGLVTLRGAGDATIQAAQGAVTATATIRVAKAVPNLAFRVPLDLLFALPSCSATPATWPELNQSAYPLGAVNPVAGVVLTSNSPGQITYRSASNALFWPVPATGSDYMLGSLEAARYANAWTYPTASTVWVEQAESANYLAASSPRLPYQYLNREGYISPDTGRMVYGCSN